MQNLFLLIAAVLALSVSGCAYVQTVESAAGVAVKKYCATTTQAERDVVRAKVNAAIAPSSIAVTCVAEPQASSGGDGLRGAGVRFANDKQIFTFNDGRRVGNGGNQYRHVTLIREDFDNMPEPSLPYARSVRVGFSKFLAVRNPHRLSNFQMRQSFIC